MLPRALRVLTVLSFGLWQAGGVCGQSPAQRPAEPLLGNLLRGSPDDVLKRLDKDSNGSLSKGELPPQLGEELFDRADANKDGRLDRPEVEALVKLLRQRLAAQAGRPTPERIVASMLERMDTNKDGKISKDEAQGPAAQSFERLDANKDGVLDKDELRTLAERFARNAPPGSPGEAPGVAQLLERMDTNKDGKISKDEAQGPLREFFDRADGNKDGFLDKEELRRVAERMRAFAGGPGGMPPRGDRLDFEALDKDADGRLTRDEVQGSPLAGPFDQVDANKDGKLDRKEVEAFRKKSADSKESR